MATTVETGHVAPAEAREELVRVYVWQWPVRIAHWTLFLSITVLSITGIYLHFPYLEAHGERAWVMGTMRFIHEIFGFVLLSTLILRVYWYFAGNRWSRWREFLPLTADQHKRLLRTLGYYGYRRRMPDLEVGHNPLAAMFYMGVYFLVAVECFTGLMLFATVSHTAIARFLVGWALPLIDIQYIRLTHYCIMFLLIAFFVHHLYSALINAFDMRNGLMGSIFSGWKFLPRSVVAEDRRAAGKRSKP